MNHREYKILLFSRYDTMGASSRVRFYQYLDFFKNNGIRVTNSPLFSNKYLNKLYRNKNIFFEVLFGYFNRLFRLFFISKYDLIILEKELFPYFPAVFEYLIKFFNIPYIVDYDDAIFHNYDLHRNKLINFILKNKIDKVMKYSSVTITGNQYLADRAINAGSLRVEIIPTVVDTNRYRIDNTVNNDLPIIGWIGSPQTSHYLLGLISVFNELKKILPFRIIAIGANTSDFVNTIVETYPWTFSSEVSSIQSFDIGIMPLLDTPWEKGKCGYKLIQCMACGVPVVASNIGVNTTLVSNNYDGFLVNSNEEWFLRLKDLLNDKENRIKMGEKGREKILQKYSLQSQSNIFLKIILNTIK